MSIWVFLGPTLAADAARALVGAECNIRPPAVRGDIYRALKAGARTIGLVDGHFRFTPSVLHKEILWAMAQGCRVFGAASMGALRAAELAPFGMIGVGSIFADFASGRLCRDDEVAIEHGPAELGFPKLSEPLVNIRYTIEACVTASIIDRTVSRRLLAIAQKFYYAERRYDAIFDRYCSIHGTQRDVRGIFDAVRANAVDQKALDARVMLARLRLPESGSDNGARPAFTLRDTAFFAEFRNAEDNPLLRILS